MTVQLATAHSGTQNAITHICHRLIQKDELCNRMKSRYPGWFSSWDRSCSRTPSWSCKRLLKLVTLGWRENRSFWRCKKPKNVKPPHQLNKTINVQSKCKIRLPHSLASTSIRSNSPNLLRLRINVAECSVTSRNRVFLRRWRSRGHPNRSWLISPIQLRSSPILTMSFDLPNKQIL